MRDIYSGLKETGVKTSNIFYEFFGEGSIETPNHNALKNQPVMHVFIFQKVAFQVNGLKVTAVY